MSNFNIGALRQLPPATFFADFRNGYTNEMVRLNTTRSTTVSTRVNNSGLIETVGANIPRLDYDPVTKAVKGLLVEPAAENKCLQSEDITTTWSTVNATLTANATTAPDGNTTADKLNDDGSGGTATVFLYQNITVSAATKYTASAWFKADQLAFAILEAASYDGGTGGYQYFGLSGDGSLGTAVNLDDSSITKYPDGWYRCSITWTQGAADTSFTFRIQVANSISSGTVDLDGTSSIFVWGAQVEEGPIATSYIPTTTIALTRNADSISLGSASSLIGQTEGTLYVEVDFKATGAEQHILSVSDGTGNNWLLIWVFGGNTKMYIDAGGSNVLSTSTASLSDGVQKLAFAYANGDQEFYRNGSSIATGTGSLAALATLTDIDLAQSPTAIRQPNMWIRAVALFKKRLTDQQLQALTGN